MCYDIRYLTKKQLDYAKRFGGDRDLSELQKRLDDEDNATGQPVFHTSGFNHSDAPIITNKEPDKVQFFSWGLIPFWVKDSHQAVQLSNRTLNAKGEELLQKPSFREPAKRKRCLVIVDGFFEHHHKKGKTYPHHILMKDESPFALGGLWEKWVDRQNDIVRHTFSIVTTRGNELLSEIHNNPKMKGPRMPVIIPEELEGIWLKEEELSGEEWEEVLNPFSSEKLKSYTVRRLRGKEYIGNRKEITIPFDYPELNSLFD